MLSAADGSSPFWPRDQHEEPVHADAGVDAAGMFAYGMAISSESRAVNTTALMQVVRLGSASAIVAAAMLSPVLYAVGVRIAEGRWDSETIYWRTSPQGVDLAAFVLPNPNHWLAPSRFGNG